MLNAVEEAGIPTADGAIAQVGPSRSWMIQMKAAADADINGKSSAFIKPYCNPGSVTPEVQPRGLS